jgi:hypothetical protein
MTLRRAAGKVATLAILLAANWPSAAAEPRLTVDGTEFVLTLPDGRSMRSRDLVGAVITIQAPGQASEVAIRAVEEDRRAISGRILLHHFEIKDRNGQWVELCSPDADGRSLGFPVPDGKGGFDLTCTSGAIGKCIRWGYRPWEQRKGGPPMQALHRACVHMTRADYGGDGSSATREGITVFPCDRFGIHPCAPAVAAPFEAAWGIDGAICVAWPRIAGIVSLEALTHRYPRLRDRVGSRVCNEDTASADPAALLFNRSAGSK